MVMASVQLKRRQLHRRREKSPVRKKKKMRPRPASGSKSVYVRVVNARNELEWYSFILNDASGEDNDRERALTDCGDFIPVPTPLKGKKVSRFSTCVAFGSTMYCIGGRCPRMKFLNVVRRFDTRHPKRSWEKVLPMLNARSDPQVVVLDSKVYVFGRTKTKSSESWGEVFNPKSSEWVPLPPPPSISSDKGLFSAACHQLSRIVVGSTKDKFFNIYNVITNCWEKWKHKMDCHSFNVQPVCVGDTLFYFQGPELHAYNMISKRCYSGDIQGLVEILSIEGLSYSAYNPVLIHLDGEEFCCICSVNSWDLTMLHCVRFQVSCNEPKGCLDAVAQSCQMCLINRPLSICDAVLF